jgi:hypothetical protein
MKFARGAVLASLAWAILNGPALAAPYANGLSFTVGNLKLDFTSCTAASVGGSGVPTNCSSLQVVPMSVPTGNPSNPFLYGFQLNGPIEALKATSETVTLTYTADVLDPKVGINDMHLIQTGSANAFARTIDTYMSGATPEGSLATNGLFPGASTAAFEIASLFDVTSVISALSAGDIGSVAQLFGEASPGAHGVPEPATIVLFGAVLVLRRATRGGRATPSRT